MADSHAPRLSYGGQAVIEGVMIRGPGHMAIAARNPESEIVTRTETLPGLVTGPLRRIPVLRGFIVLYETLALGMRALNWSAQVAAGNPSAEITPRQIARSMLTTVVLVAAVFFALPVLVTAWIEGTLGVAIEGVLRIALLIGYVWAIGRVPEIGRVFMYHGAEHRAIHAYEHGRPLTRESIREYPNAHARCGTAFLLTVMVLAFVLFLALGTPPLLLRLAERVVLVPLIAAVAYEVLRLGQRFGDTPVLGWVYAPNIWLQRLTTRNPDDAQIDVAIAALEAALALDRDAVAGTRRAADNPLS